MGEAAGASGASIASAGLGAYASIKKGEGVQASDEFQAKRAERAAAFGKLQAEQTDTVMRENLNTTLANIEVIRAAAHIDPTSPTSAAIEERQTMVSERQRRTALLNTQSQVAEDEASGKYLRDAGDYALKQGYLEAGIKLASAGAKGLTA